MHKSEKTFDDFLDRAKLPIVPMEDDMTKINLSRAFHASKAKNPTFHTPSEYEEYFERKEREARDRAKQRQDRRAYALAKGSPTVEEDRVRLMKIVAGGAVTKALNKKSPVTLPRLACLEKPSDLD